MPQKDSCRILLVDDEKDLADIVAEELKMFGFTVAVCYSAQEAYDQIRCHPFDLVISDIWMLGKSGFDLLNWLKMDDRFKHIPLIFMTAFSEISTNFEVKKAVAGILVKPFEMEDLIEMVRGVTGPQSLHLPEIIP